MARDEVFVTTKYNPRRGGDERDHRWSRASSALGTDHVDLWLVHAPADDNVRVWESFVAAQSAGQARDIGVSNFSLGQVDRVHEATGVLPAVNQIEWRPSLYDARVADGHASRGVVLEGYSALKGGSLRDPVVTPGRRRGRPHPRPGAGPLARPARLRRHPPLLEGRPGAVQRRRRRVRALRRPDGRPRRSGPRLRSPTQWLTRGMDAVAAAFDAMPREGFLPRGERRRASYDGPLPIGHGQTSSQPRTVAAMLRLLEVAPGQPCWTSGRAPAGRPPCWPTWSVRPGRCSGSSSSRRW